MSAPAALPATQPLPDGLHSVQRAAAIGATCPAGLRQRTLKLFVLRGLEFPSSVTSVGAAGAPLSTTIARAIDVALKAASSATTASWCVPSGMARVSSA